MQITGMRMSIAYSSAMQMRLTQMVYISTVMILIVYLLICSGQFQLTKRQLKLP